ncbi:GNAT family N-acetyltransferase [Pandoraea sp.]|uniref:GNAT family N-acetyltransferase n=1 Tax=Pandoraea sp. TaxID=1883445 RepID=UPI0025FC77C1|nr:GNAT family N-acetyltransferase [Pandoraea sp.]
MLLAPMQWHCKRFESLQADELYGILAARAAVFVLEQRCLYADIDGKDERALHVFAQAPGESGQVIIAAYARLLRPGVSYPEASLGRVLTAAAYRRTGMGRRLVAYGLDCIQTHWPRSTVRIGAQMYLQRFYESFGFVRVGEPYDEDGIPHLEMLRHA